jgi:endonuclease/exonuclease/phosphatase family metal-dependent hydrolase
LFNALYWYTFLVLFLLTLLAICAEPQGTTFRAMTFNIWRGGTQFKPLEQTIEVIKKSNADIVGIQEPDDSLEAIAKGLGWSRSDKASIVTRFEIIEDWSVEGSRWGGAVVRLPNGRDIVFLNTHLNPFPYGPYEVRDKKATTKEELQKVEEESGRVRQMKAMLESLASKGNGRPVVFTGDFNTPSHLDWVASTQERNFGVQFKWPVTLMAAEVGLRDAFRTIHPDPAKTPGFTWSPGYPAGTFEPDDVMDRIDFVFYRGLTVVDAWVVGESGPHTYIAIDPWPSDHRAVAADFRLD